MFSAVAHTLKTIREEDRQSPAFSQTLPVTLPSFWHCTAPFTLKSSRLGPSGSQFSQRMSVFSFLPSLWKDVLAGHGVPYLLWKDVLAGHRVLYLLWKDDVLAGHRVPYLQGQVQLCGRGLA